ncbi:MAG: DHA2 family efflux MFS transporter permease subunit, partial [Coriobacteriales bacterium]|nr:DHA2 family efflux MFS transporter permease subunit [Coriobacteriales bacterium]
MKLGITRKQLIMLAVLISGCFLTILNQTLVNPAFSSIMKDLQVDASTVQWLATGFTMVNAIMIPISAYLQDRFDTRKLFITSELIFALGTVLCAWGPNFGVLLAGRLTQALGAGVLMPMVMTVMLLTFPTERRGVAMGWFGVIIGVAPTFGPVISGVIIDRWNWHVMFYCVAALALIIILLACIFLEKVKEGNRDAIPLDKPSVILSSLGFGLVLYSFSVVGSRGPSLLALIPLLVGGVVLFFFFRRQLSMETPMLQVRVLASRRFLVGTVIPMVVQAATMANAVLIPLFVQDLCGQSATITGLVLLPGAVVMAVMSPINGSWFDKHGPRGMSILGTGLLTLTTLAVCFITPSIGMVALAVLMCARSFSFSLINMPVSTWGLNALDNRVMNHGNAVNNTFRQVAGSLGTALVISTYSLVGTGLTDSLGSTMAYTRGFNIAFALQALLCFAAFIMVIIMVRDKESDIVKSDIAGERRGTVESLMHREVFSLPQDALVADAVRLFTSKNISAAPIVDEDGEPIGFISDGDVIRAIGTRGSSFVDPISLMIVSVSSGDDDQLQRIDDIMSRPAVSIATAGVISVDIHSSIEEICHVLGS